ncbi:MAG: hypothetical protein IAI50_04970, partial [Candidatus Eremiobacteraeota bacterium]|nr:hypothetical protein [Candidatus Eremiobacteraeota bacterium]
MSGTATLALLAGCSGGGGSTPATSPAFSQQAIGARSMSMSHQLVTGHSVLKPGMPQFHGGVPGIGFMTEDATKGGSVFVSDAVNLSVDIFSSAGKETGSITANLSEPQGLTTDKAGNLYLANTGDSNILVYAKGYKGTPVTIPDAGQYPVGVAVDADGNIGVTNIISTSDGAGSVSFIAKAAK